MAISSREFCPGAFNKELTIHRRWLRRAGTLLFMMGILNIILLLFPSSIQDKLIGVSLIIISLVIFIHSFLFWHGKTIGYILHLLTGFLYFIVGMTFLLDYKSQIAMQLLIISLLNGYIIMSYFRIKISTIQQNEDLRWRWTCLAGAINFLIVLFLLGNKLFLAGSQVALLI